MFNFLMDAYNPNRGVGRYEEGQVIVDTCSVSDGRCIYETGVMHPEYNDGKFVIVSAYDTEEEARQGHDQWVKTMTADTLPDKLVDCCNSELAQIGKDFGMETVFPRAIT